MLKSIKYVLLSTVIFLSNNSIANLITNGDFQNNINGWYTSGGVNVVNDTVVLKTDIGYSPLNTSILAQGDDGTFSFLEPIILTNDIKWLTFDVKVKAFDDFLESGLSTFNDVLRINFYDELDFTGASDLLFSSDNYSFLNEQWQTVQLNVGSLSGHSIALSFELFDENNKLDSIFQLDNIAFTNGIISTPVSEPTTFILLFITIVLFKSVKRRY
jgi:hypothetical protein